MIDAVIQYKNSYHVQITSRLARAFFLQLVHHGKLAIASVVRHSIRRDLFRSGTHLECRFRSSTVNPSLRLNHPGIDRRLYHRWPFPLALVRKQFSHPRAWRRWFRQKTTLHNVKNSVKVANKFSAVRPTTVPDCCCSLSSSCAAEYNKLLLTSISACTRKY